MSQSHALLVLSLLAAADLAACRFVSPTNGVPSAGGNTLGVANSDAATGDYCPVTAVGTAIVEASAAISKGDLVETLDDGRAQTKDTGVAVGRALQEATAAGQKIEVLLIQN